MHMWREMVWASPLVRRSTVKRQISHCHRSVLLGCLPSDQLSGFFFHTRSTLGPSPGVCMYPSAKMDLEVKASGRSKTHYGLELSPDFWLQGALVHTCSISLILYSDRVFASLCPCPDYSLEMFFVVVFQSLSRVWLFATPCTAAPQASLSFTISQRLLKLISIESVMPSNHLNLCHLLLLLPSIFPSIRVFSNELVLRIRWPKYWSFSINLSNAYSGLISFRIVCFDLLAVQGTLKSLLQHHTSKASILQHSAFFVVQLSHPYMTTGKTIALTIRTFVGKVMSLLFNMLSSPTPALLPGKSHGRRSLVGCSPWDR